MEDTETDGGVSPVSHASSSDWSLSKLIESEKFTSVLSFYKANKDDLIKDNEDLYDPSNDVHTILGLYCQKIVIDRPGECFLVVYKTLNIFFSECFVMTSKENDLQDIFGRLFQVSAAVCDLEAVVMTQIEKLTDSKI